MKKLIVSIISIMCIIGMSGCSQESELDNIRNKADEIMDAYTVGTLDGDKARSRLDRLYEDIDDVEGDKIDKLNARNHLMEYFNQIAEDNYNEMIGY